MEHGWLETANCFLALDGNLIIGFPTRYDDDIDTLLLHELPVGAEQLLQKTLPE